jgi:hypothetical protein
MPDAIVLVSESRVAGGRAIDVRRQGQGVI